MATENFFTWGAGGAKLTPEQIALARQLLARKNAQGADTSPVQHWAQGAARVADALGDVIQEKRLSSQEKDLTDYNGTLLSTLMGSNGASASTSPVGASMPMPGAASQIGAGAPSPVKPGGVPEISDYVRQAAIARGIDPEIALRVAGHEGLNVFDPSKPDGGGDEGSSFGPFQLHYAGMSKSMPNAGLGDEFTKATGLHARDPSTWKQQIDFSLDWARKNGWSPWMGAKAEGITGMMGIGAAPTVKPGEVASLDPAAGLPMPGAGGQMRVSDPAPTVVPPPVASVPAVVPPPVQAPAPNIQVAQDTSGPALANAIKVLSDPRANANTKAVAEIMVRQAQARQQAILEQNLKQSDPGYQADLKLKQLQADQIANPRISPTDQANIDLNREKFGFERESSALTPDIKEYKFAKDNGYTGSFAQYQLDLKKSAANNTTINTGEGNKFYNTLDENNAKIFSGLSDAGIQGRSKLGQIDQLDQLLQSTGSGWATALKAKAGDFGINTEKLDDIQAASALISKMIPAQREPGSGPVSDADLEGFRNSLPRLINQPGGNATIVNTMRGLTQYQIQMGEIADRVANRELTPAEGRVQIANLPNPLSTSRLLQRARKAKVGRKFRPISPASRSVGKTKCRPMKLTSTARSSRSKRLMTSP